MNDIVIACPKCGKKIKIMYDASGNPSVFLLGDTTESLSIDEAFDRFGICFGERMYGD